MGLSHPGTGVFANLRNAVAGVWWLRSVRAGAVRAQEFCLAERTAVGARRMIRAKASDTDALQLDVGVRLERFVIAGWTRKQAGSPFAAQTGSLCSVFHPTPCGTTSLSDFTFSAPVSVCTVAAPSRGIVLANGRPLNTPSKISFTRNVRPSVLVTLSIFGSQ